MRRSETSTLAFLDVMACGLGAVILILVVLKQQGPAEKPLQPETFVTSEKIHSDLEKLQNKLDRLLAAQNSEQTVLEQQRQNLVKITTILEEVKEDVAAANTKGSALNQSINRAKAKLEQNQQMESPSDTVSIQSAAQPEYLVGMQVKGSKILILLDRSASMTARSLVDILRYKSGPAVLRRSAIKWVKAQNAVWWMITRAPNSANVQIASFGERTDFHTTGWVSAQDSAQLARVKNSMTALVPEGSTNLESAMDAAIKTGADNIYIITDGLPTSAPGGKTLFGLDGCGSKLSKRKQVTGECRVSLFQRTVAASAKKKVRISVVLLPLEGDPDAAPLFSKWALSKGGILLSAARNWP